MLAKLWPFVVGSVALGLDAYVVAGLLPNIAADLHTESGTVGLGVAAFTASYAVAGPVLAGAAGRTARGSMLLSLGAFVAGNIVTAVSPSSTMFLLSRVVAGAAAGVYSPLSTTVAGNAVASERRGRALSLVLAGLACGTVFGVPLGLFVARALSWRFTFGLIAVLGLVGMLGVLFRGVGRVENIHAPSLGARMRTMRRSANVLTMLVTLLTGVASLGLYTYLVPVLEDMGLGAVSMEVIWVWGIGGALGALLVGHLVDAVARPAVLTAIIALALTTSFVVLGLSPSVLLVFVAVFCWGVLGWSSLAPQQHTLMAANPDDGATVVAANSSANYLGSAIGSSVGALLLGLQVSGSQLVFWAAVPAALAFGVQLTRMRVRS